MRKAAAAMRLMRVTLIVVIAALLGAIPAAGAAAVKKAPSPQAQVRSAFKQLVTDTGKLPKRAHRAALLRTVKRAGRQARRRPCAAARTLKGFSRRLKPGALRDQLKAEVLHADAAMMQLPSAKRCGGGHASKVATVSAQVLRSSAKQLRMRISLPPPTFVGQHAGGQDFQQMFIDGMGETDAGGKPGLPAVQKFFGIPVGANVGLTVNGTQGYDLNGVNLYPQQKSPVDEAAPPGAPPLSEFLDGPFQIDSKAYRSRRTFPARPAHAGALGKMRDLRIGGVDVTGGQYKPKTGTLHVFTSIDVTVKFGGRNSGKFGSAPDFNDPWNAHFARNYSALVVNGAAVASNLGNVPLHPFCGEEMLVVTDAALRPAANTFAAARAAAGIDTRVVEVGASAGQIGTTQEQIQAYILGELNANCTRRPSYVVLLGDTSHVPTWHVPCSAGGDLAECNIPTDLPYSLNGTADLFADVQLGRIPAIDLAMANAVVSKTVNYENTMPAPYGSDFYSHATVTGFFEQRYKCVLNTGESGTPNCDPNAGTVNGFYEPDYPNHTDGRGFTKTSDRVINEMGKKSYTVDRIWTDSGDPQTLPEKYYDGTDIPAKFHKPAFPWNGSGTDLLNDYNAGRFMIFHRDHGWNYGWSHPYLTNSDVPSMTNGSKLPVVFGVNCASATFDIPGSPSFVEAQIEKADGGAVAGFGDTQVSPTWPNNNMALGFFDALFPDLLPNFGSPTFTHRLGDILLSGKAYMATQNSGTAAYQEHYLYHLLGDPSMQMWAADPTVFNPTKIVVDYKAIAHVNPGDPVFQVVVHVGGGGPHEPAAPGTIATLFSGDKAIGRGIVGADGNVTITPNDATNGNNLHVALDQEGALPAQKDVAGSSTMTIQCPADGTAPGTLAVHGTLTGPGAGATVHVHYSGPNGQSISQDARTAASGSWSDRAAMTSGQWTITATFDGDASFGEASASCSFRAG
ncbi:MAG: hypothetical protein QOF37_1425 [Thermoleophilaceae bacterium]|nr:hypothetical protein [Thermoleophilaceae bacterium]